MASTLTDPGVTAGTATGPSAARPAVDVPAVRLEGVVKRWGDVTAVAGLDLDVRDGEFFSMLGPSGSGKTTTLRMIAGFELPTEGRVLLHGQDVTRLAPFERDVNTVFQDYALFPHMTVGDNVGYGLMVRKVAKAERARRVDEALEMVRLVGYEKRKPGQLSGGQRQRVALARALVNRPRVLLLDEPLGALDLKLREEMQIELKRIQQEVGITFIYVTHDQEEALTMSDRLAVFNAGRIEQVGRPRGGLRAAGDAVRGRVRRDVQPALRGGGPADPGQGRHVHDPAREDPAHTTRGTARADEVAADGRVREVVYLGPDTRYIVALDAGAELVVTQQNLSTSRPRRSQPQGRTVRLIWKRQHALAVADGGARVEEGLA